MKGKGFGWGTGGVFEGRGMFPGGGDDAASSRFEELAERERKMDARLKARIRAASLNTARREEFLAKNGGLFIPVPDNTSAGVWDDPRTGASYALYQNAYLQRKDAKESDYLFRRTKETRGAQAQASSGSTSSWTPHGSHAEGQERASMGAEKTSHTSSAAPHPPPPPPSPEWASVYPSAQERRRRQLHTLCAATLAATTSYLCISYWG